MAYYIVAEDIRFIGVRAVGPFLDNLRIACVVVRVDEVICGVTIDCFADADAFVVVFVCSCAVPALSAVGTGLYRLEPALQVVLMLDTLNLAAGVTGNLRIDGAACVVGIINGLAGCAPVGLA